MSESNRVVIVSAFGRGHWLASELKKMNLDVLLIDMSHRLGNWPSEDIEGPFGFFKSDEFNDSQMEKIFSFDSYEEVVNGLTVLTNLGPIEFKGPMTKFHMDVNHMKVKSWMDPLSRLWANTIYYEYNKKMMDGKSLPLMQSFFVKSTSRVQFEKSFQWLVDKGIQVYKNSEIIDVAYAGSNKAKGLELQGDVNGLIPLDQLCWALTSEQTYFISPKVAEFLYPKKMIDSHWCWLRYRLTIKKSVERDLLPLHVLLIEDIDSPWTHSYFIVLQRTVLEDQFDGWMRLPTVQRFNKEYLEKRGQEMISKVSNKLSGTEVEIQHYPQEYYYSYHQLGAPLFPVFSLESRQKKPVKNKSNIYFMGPEVVLNYSKQDNFKVSEAVLSQISQWWRALQINQEKKRRGMDR